MKKKKKGYSFCELNQYGVHVIGLLGYSEGEAEAFIREMYGIHVPHSADGSCMMLERDGKYHVLIQTRVHSLKPMHLALLVHETLHASLMILKIVGQGVDCEDHEHLAYMQQFIFQAMLESKSKN